MTDDGLQCWVYRSPRKQEMYLYLAQEDGFDRVPDALLARFGDPVLVIELELHPGRRLAREDVNSVILNLRNLGYHLQLPPRLEPALYQGNQD
ncbi:MAG: YcgL domain-containing protein [Sedimenticolaceae bacterium]